MIEWGINALNHDASIAVFNNNELYEAGNNITGWSSDKSSPVQVGSGTDWTYVDAGNDYTMAVKSNGTLWAWGLNTDGNLGDGTILPKDSPVQIGTLTNWAKVSTGRLLNRVTLALKTDGSVVSWGVGVSGAPANTQSGVINIFTNNSAFAALKSDGSIVTWGYSSWGGDSSCVQDERFQPHEATLLRLDCRKARVQLEWVPKWNLMNAVTKTVDWYRACSNFENMTKFSLDQIVEYQKA